MGDMDVELKATGKYSRRFVAQLLSQNSFKNQSAFCFLENIP
jgi:hypothetical protein